MTRRRWGLVAGVATLALFTPTLISFHEVWTSGAAAHGYLIALATAWLVWQERDVFADEWVGWTPALVTAALLSLVWLVAAVGWIQSVAQAVVALLFLAWCGAVYGRPALTRLGPPVAVFFIALPVWTVLQPILQALTVIMSGGAAALFGVPATIMGAAVRIPSGTFLVENACAGMNYFVAAIAVAALFGTLFMRRWPTRAAIVAVAAIASMIGNWVRVTSLIMIGHKTQMQAPLLYNHGWFGWVIFVVVLALLLPVAHALERWERRRWPMDHALPTADAAQTAIDLDGKGRATGADTPGQWQDSGSLRPIFAASIAAALGPLVYFGVGSLPNAAEKPFDLDPGESSAWHVDGDATRPFEWKPNFAGFDDHVAAVWTDGSRRAVIERMVYRNQEQGSELIGYFNQIAADSLVLADRPVIAPRREAPGRRIVRSAIVSDGEGYVLVWYWYRVGGVDTASRGAATLLELPAFFRRADLSELVALSAECGPEDCADAAAALAEILAG